MDDPKDTKDTHKKQRFPASKANAQSPKKHLSTHLLFNTSDRKDEGEIDSLYAKTNQGPEVGNNDATASLGKSAMLIERLMTKTAVDKRKIIGGILAATGVGFGLKGLQGTVESIINMPAKKEMLDLIGSNKDMSAKEVKAMAKLMGLKMNVNVAKTPREVADMARDKGKYGNITSKMLALATRGIYDEGSNAAYLPPQEKGEHVLILAPKTSATVVAHELGHAKDFENIGSAKKMNKKYSMSLFSRLSLPFSKKPLEDTLLKRETTAWENVPKKLREKRTEEMALKSYRTSIDSMQASSQMTAGFLLGMGGRRLMKSKGQKKPSGSILKNISSKIRKKFFKR